MLKTQTNIAANIAEAKDQNRKPNANAVIRIVTNANDLFHRVELDSKLFKNTHIQSKFAPRDNLSKAFRLKD